MAESKPRRKHKSAAQIHDELEVIGGLMDKFVVARRKADEAAKAKEEAYRPLVNAMIDGDHKEAETETAKGTRIDPESDVIDWDGLSGALSNQQWLKITRRVPIKALLEQAIKDGDISLSVVAKYTSTEKGTTSVRVTVK